MRNSDEVLDGQWQGIRNLATQIDAELSYVAIGQTAYVVDFAWYTPDSTRFNQADAVERRLNDVAVPIFFLDVDATELIPADEPLRVGFDLMIPARHYDGLIFQMRSRANVYAVPPPG